MKLYSLFSRKGINSTLKCRFQYGVQSVCTGNGYNRNFWIKKYQFIGNVTLHNCFIQFCDTIFWCQNPWQAYHFDIKHFLMKRCDAPSSLTVNHLHLQYWNSIRCIKLNWLSFSKNDMFQENFIMQQVAIGSRGNVHSQFDWRCAKWRNSGRQLRSWSGSALGIRIIFVGYLLNTFLLA